MREYFALYDKKHDMWGVAYRDDFEDTIYVELWVETGYLARRIAGSLNGGEPWESLLMS